VRQKKQKLRIGRIPYANLFPIFYTLEREFDCSSYEFIEGPPSALNRMLREGSVDISPSSSIEYLRNPFLYSIVEGHSISSKGPVGSIFLFSQKTLEKLDGSIVYVSSQSETSIALLSIILKTFNRIHCTLDLSNNPEESDGNAFLLIGDDALKYNAGQKVSGRRLTNAVYPIIYDLGDIWYRQTGLPFVFALWIMKKKIYQTERESSISSRNELLHLFIESLNSAKNIALRNLPEISKHSPLRAFLSQEEIIRYWDNLDYELTLEHKKGLELFNNHLKDLVYF